MRKEVPQELFINFETKEILKPRRLSDLEIRRAVEKATKKERQKE